MKTNAFRLALLCLNLFSFHAAAMTYYVDINSTNATPPYTNWSTASTDIQSANESSLITTLNRLKNETLK